MSHDIQVVDERQLVGFRARELAPARLYQQLPANDEVLLLANFSGELALDVAQYALVALHLGSEDPEALWAFLHTSTGADDLSAWKRLLIQLEFRDPRRSLAAARVGELRRAALM